MKYYKIKDSKNNTRIIKAKDEIEAVEIVKKMERNEDKIVIGVHDGIEFSFYDGKFYADDTQIKDKYIIDVKKGASL